MATNTIIAQLKAHFGVYTDTALAEKLQVSQSTIASWKSRKVPNHILMQYEAILEDSVTEGIHMVANREPRKISGTGENQPKLQKEGDAIMEAQYLKELSDLQKEKIHHQQQEITQLKELLNGKQAESTHWDALEYDFKVHIEISRENGMLGRKITSVDNLTPFMDTLGYSKEEADAIWSVGTPYPAISDHPIDNIVDKETKAEMAKSSSSLPLIFDSLKHMIGYHYIPFACGYIAKDGSIVPSIAYNKILWRKLEVISKIKFLAAVE